MNKFNTGDKVRIIRTQKTGIIKNKYELTGHAFDDTIPFYCVCRDSDNISLKYFEEELELIE